MGSFIDELIATGGMPSPQRGMIVPNSESPSDRSAPCRDQHVMPEDWSHWGSGVDRLASIRAKGCWPDGRTLGCGHPSPILRPVHAQNIQRLRKTVEGRPREGFAAKACVDDWINFNVSQSNGRRLVCRVMWVKSFATFDAMLAECTVEACLPDLQGSCADAAALYRTFRTRGRRGVKSYAELEVESGVVAIGIRPV